MKAASPQKIDVTVGTETISITTPFPSPEDWRDQWIYFLMLDRFNNPVALPQLSPWDGDHGWFQGGTLNGVKAQLPYLKQLGVGAIWLSPVLKNCPWNNDSHHGYGIQDFLEIEPRFGSNPSDPAVAERELRALVDAAHAQGIYVILDIVLNHGGDVFAYEGHGADAPWKGSGAEYEIRWRDAAGQPISTWTEAAAIPEPRPRDGVVWPTELQRNDFWRRRGKDSPNELRGDFASLKELVTEYLAPENNYPVREILIRAHQYLIAKYDIDGFRIDTLKHVSEDFARIFGGAMREFALSIGKKNFFTFGEVWNEHDEEKIAGFVGRNTLKVDDPIGVDAALDFPLFRRLNNVVKFSQAPSAIQDLFDIRKQAHQDLLSSHGEASKYYVTFLDNHDLNSRFYYRDPSDPDRFDDQLTLALGCLYTLQGIPCLYYGTEQGLHGNGWRREFVREALWGKPNAFDQSHPFYQAIQALSVLRQKEPALRYGRQYFRPESRDGDGFGISTDANGVLAFSRILHDREVLIVANLSTTDDATRHIVIDANLNPAETPFRVLYSNKSNPRKPSETSCSRHPRSVQVSLQPMEIQILGR
jgi:glycosidase